MYTGVSPLPRGKSKPRPMGVDSLQDILFVTKRAWSVYKLWVRYDDFETFYESVIIKENKGVKK